MEISHYSQLLFSFSVVCTASLFALCAINIFAFRTHWTRQALLGGLLGAVALTFFNLEGTDAILLDLRGSAWILAGALGGIPGSVSALVVGMMSMGIVENASMMETFLGLSFLCMAGLVCRVWLDFSKPLMGGVLLGGASFISFCALLAGVFLWGQGGSSVHFALSLSFFLHMATTAISGIFLGSGLYRHHILENALLALSDAHKSNQAKSDFLARVSHELRTPVAVILGYLELFKNRDLPDNFSTEFDSILRASRSLSMLINDLLDVARSEQGLLHVQKCSFNPQVLVRDLVELFATSAHEKGIVLEGECDGDIPSLLQGDEGRIRQILFNVVGNAVKYTQKGSVCIFASYIKSGLIIVVKDTGIGMEKHEISRMFMPHVQDPRGSAYSKGGLGLGLAISRQLASTLGGTLTAESEPGKGTEFSLMIPVEMVEKFQDIPYPNQNAQKENAAPALKQYRILIAEDTSSLRRLTQRVLEDAGATVFGVSHGQEALEALEKNSFDVVIMDMGMPIMDGKEATKRIRASDQPWSTIPIIALTADAVQSNRNVYENIGLSAFMTKPVSWPHLIEAISQFPHADEQTSSESFSTPLAEKEPAMISSTLVHDEQSPPVDYGAQLALKEAIGEAAFGELMHTCWEDTDRVLDELLRSETLKAEEQLVEAAHKLRGIALNFGYPQLAHLAMRLEMARKEQKADGPSIAEIIAAAKSAKDLTKSGSEEAA